MAVTAATRFQYTDDRGDPRGGGAFVSRGPGSASYLSRYELRPSFPRPLASEAWEATIVAEHTTQQLPKRVPRRTERVRRIYTGLDCKSSACHARGSRRIDTSDLRPVRWNARGNLVSASSAGTGVERVGATAGSSLTQGISRAQATPTRRYRRRAAIQVTCTSVPPETLLKRPPPSTAHTPLPARRQRPLRPSTYASWDRPSTLTP